MPIAVLIRRAAWLDVGQEEFQFLLLSRNTLVPVHSLCVLSGLLYRVTNISWKRMNVFSTIN